MGSRAASGVVAIAAAIANSGRMIVEVLVMACPFGLNGSPGCEVQSGTAASVAPKCPGPRPSNGNGLAMILRWVRDVSVIFSHLRGNRAIAVPRVAPAVTVQGGKMILTPCNGANARSLPDKWSGGSVEGRAVRAGANGCRSTLAPDRRRCAQRDARTQGHAGAGRAKRNAWQGACHATT